MIAAPHPVWRPHLFQGWAADFIPQLVSKAYKSDYIDEVMHPGGDDAINTSRELAVKEGIFSGTSGGGVLASARKIAETAPSGTSILAIIPDTGERYLSTPLFDNIPADMTEEEKALTESTASTAPPPPDLPGVVPEATEFVKQTVNDNKVVFWSLQYCEFCWTLMKLLDTADIPYEAINIDSFKYAKDQMGNKYRAALCDMTGCNTFPQLFVNGEFVGGAVDACMMWKDGELQKKLSNAGVEFGEYEGDPFEFLPKWMSQNPLRSK